MLLYIFPICSKQVQTNGPSNFFLHNRSIQDGVTSNTISTFILKHFVLSIFSTTLFSRPYSTNSLKYSEYFCYYLKNEKLNKLNNTVLDTLFLNSWHPVIPNYIPLTRQHTTTSCQSWGGDDHLCVYLTLNTHCFVHFITLLFAEIITQISSLQVPIPANKDGEFQLSVSWFFHFFPLSLIRNHGGSYLGMRTTFTHPSGMTDYNLSTLKQGLNWGKHT